MRIAGIFIGASALLAVACMREGAPPVAPVEAADIGDAGAMSALVIAAPLTPPRETCRARLRAQTIKTGAGCTLDEHISHGDGTLLFPCSGEGPAEASFGVHHFIGSVGHGSMKLALTTELDWEDGCHWETKQAITGSFAREGREGTPRPTLSWAYTERPVDGASCYGSCVATANIEVDELPP